MTSRTTRPAVRGMLAMLKREDCKAIKHMNKDQMEYYLKCIYQRGYEDGVKAMARQMETEAATFTVEVQK